MAGLLTVALSERRISNLTTAQISWLLVEKALGGFTTRTAPNSGPTWYLSLTDRHASLVALSLSLPLSLYLSISTIGDGLGPNSGPLSS